MKITSVITAAVLCAGAPSSAFAVNLITNGSFEDPAGPGPTGQGFLTPPWTTIAVGADIYSNDGSYGLSPGAFGNFLGVTAYDGNRWAAGWSLVPEPLVQPLSGGPLVAGTTYSLTGALHQALRSDLDFSGGYKVYATDGSVSAFLVNTGATINDLAWITFAVTFTAPSGVGSLPFLEFIPYASDAGTAYPGLDALNLSPTAATPLPAALPLFATGLGALGLLGWRRKRKAAAIAAA